MLPITPRRININLSCALHPGFEPGLSGAKDQRATATLTEINVQLYGRNEEIRTPDFQFPKLAAYLLRTFRLKAGVITTIDNHTTLSVCVNFVSVCPSISRIGIFTKPTSAPSSVMPYFTVSRRQAIPSLRRGRTSFCITSSVPYFFSF